MTLEDDEVLNRLANLINAGKLTVNDFRRIRKAFDGMARIADAEDVFHIQGQQGNWDYDEYMHGMYNGMALILSIWKGEATPAYRNSPETFVYENNPPAVDKLSLGYTKNGSYDKLEDLIYKGEDEQKPTTFVEIHNNCTDDIVDRVVDDVLKVLKIKGVIT